MATRTSQTPQRQKLPIVTYKVALNVIYTETYKTNRDAYCEEIQDFIDSIYTFYDKITEYYTHLCTEMKKSGITTGTPNKLVINYEYDDSDYQDWDMRVVVKCTDNGLYDYVNDKMWILQNICFNFDDIFESITIQEYTPKIKFHSDKTKTKTQFKSTKTARNMLTR